MNLFLILGIFFVTFLEINCATKCQEPNCIQYDLKSQSYCTQSSILPPSTKNWQSLDTTLDQINLKLTIIAYKIELSNGIWSDWIVKGFNDIDNKFNPKTKDLRRLWANFESRKHFYIYCSAQSK